MNRLVLIGNGFDLAHGLKTGYKDFITDYLWKSFNEFAQKKTYDDALINISANVGSQAITEKLDPIYEKIIEAINFLRSPKNNSNAKFNYNSTFFESLIKHCSIANWVDIEIAYFDQLKENQNSPELIIKLNNQFKFLKEKLHDYLVEIDVDGYKMYNTEYSDFLCEPIKKSEIVKVDLENDITPLRLYILNFNYTSTFDRYINHCGHNIETSVNYIHGKLKNISNPIIFGYGDEYDNDYKKFENHRNNDLFPHIKSFAYSRTKNYHDLVRFTNADDFQVYIMGHACGLSDRTMLKHIFEHERCKSIKIYYYKNSDNFFNTTYDIARHFDDKNEMRIKIVSFEHLDEMPQCE